MVVLFVRLVCLSGLLGWANKPLLGIHGGVSLPNKKYDKSRASIPARICRAVKVESGHACAIKGCMEHTYLEIHHINENREDNRTENLILLCDKHHKMSHAGVIDRKSLREYKNLNKLPVVDDLLVRFEQLEAMVKESNETDCGETVSQGVFNLILEEARLLGSGMRGTIEGNKVADQMFSLIRMHGSTMGVESIDLMVTRDESYSRVGLSGLGILYDKFFSHVASLGLVGHYEEKGMLDVSYYCALRENFSEHKDFSACMKSAEFKYHGLSLECDAYYLISKYPNRGPSVVLDCLKLKNP